MATEFVVVSTFTPTQASFHLIHWLTSAANHARNQLESFKSAV
jgi:hypothetical protein